MLQFVRIICGIIAWYGITTTSDAAQLHLVVGPVRLDALTMGWNYQQPFHQDVPIELTSDLWVTRTEVQLVDGDGNPLPRQLLCHSLLRDFRDADHPILRLGWTGERTLTSFPEGTGVLLRSGQLYHWETMFQNPYDRIYPELYLRITLAVEPAGEGRSGQEALELMGLCIGGCQGHAMLYAAPPGLSVKQDEVRFPASGRVVVMTAHLHRYGQRLALEALDGAGEGTPRLIWETRPIGDPSSEFRTPYWVPPSAWHVTPSDRFRLTAEYENPTSHDWPAMGLIMVYFVPSQP